MVLPALFLAGMNSTVTDLARPFVVTELSSDRYRFQWVTGATLLGAVSGMSLIGWTTPPAAATSTTQCDRPTACLAA